MVSNLFHHLIGIVDTVFMGELSTESSTPLAAIGVASLFFFVLSMMAYGFSIGAQIVIARRAGEGNKTAIGQIVQVTTGFLLFGGLLMALVVKLSGEWIFSLLVRSPEVQAACVAYLDYRIWELIPSAFLLTLIAFYSGIGRTSIIMVSTVLMTIVNVVFNYGLVFGKLGMPRMEIAGAGLASFIAALMAMTVLITHMYWKGYHREYLFSSRISASQSGHDNFSLLGKVSKLSVPIVVQHSLGTAVWFFFFMLLEKIGEEELAVSNVIKMIYLLLGVTSWGLGSALNTVVSNLIGQNRRDDVMQATRRALWLSAGFSLVFVASIFIWGDSMLRFFVPDRPDLVALGSEATIVAGGALFVMAVSNIWFRATTGAGATLFTLAMEFFALPFYVLFVLWAVNLEMPSSTVLSWAWGGEYVYWSIMALTSWWYMRSGRWKSKEV